MELTIKRLKHSLWGVDGELWIDNRRVCDICEHPVLHLPPGRYNIKVEYCQVLRRKAPVIETELPPTNNGKNQPIIGIGNGPMALQDGTILVGRHYLDGVLMISHDTFAKLIDRLDKAQCRRVRMCLVI